MLQIGYIKGSHQHHLTLTNNHLSVAFFSYILFFLLLAFLFFLPVSLSAESVKKIELNEPILPLTIPENLNSLEIELGKQLFKDTRLSGDNTVSCSSCHDIANGGDDGLPKSIGIKGRTGNVNAPTVLSSSLNIAQFWDGRAKNLEEQAAGPIHNPLEMDSNWQDVIQKLSASKGLEYQFNLLYRDGITSHNIAKALAVYQESLLNQRVPFDEYLKGDVTAISEEAKEGYNLFKSLGCISCHQGKNIGGNMFQTFGLMGDYFKDRGNITEADLGRYNVTGNEKDRYIFKVPSLRNVAKTAPYFHDGSAETLEQAIEIMVHYQLGIPIKEEEVKKIKAFLLTLTGEVDRDLL